MKKWSVRNTGTRPFFLWFTYEVIAAVKPAILGGSHCLASQSSTLSQETTNLSARWYAMTPYLHPWLHGRCFLPALDIRALTGGAPAAKISASKSCELHPRRSAASGTPTGNGSSHLVPQPSPWSLVVEPPWKICLSTMRHQLDHWWRNQDFWRTYQGY